MNETVKEKILEALNVTLEDLSECRLIEILIDAYKAKESEVSELKAANNQERVDLALERGQMRQEYHKMRSDPLYGAAGNYCFALDDKKFQVHVQGKVELMERRGCFDVRAIPLSQAEFEGLRK